jgi:hypothetical protein
MELKMKAVQNCREFGLNVVLVPTIINGINDHEIGPIIDFALKDNNIKMVNFQPGTLVGRYNLEDRTNKRMTIPDVLNAIEVQTGGLLKKESFINVPCPYPTCSVSSYIYKSSEKTIVLTELFEVEKYMNYISNRAVPHEDIANEVSEAVEQLFSMSTVMGSDKTENAICTSCGIAIPNIKELVDNITLIQVHAFMDEYNFDIKRAKKCCITEILPNGQMIPLCVYNILYRKELIPTFGNNK